MSKVHNFSAGPCILPPEVLKGAADAVGQFNDLNLSLIEVSHRGKDFIAVAEKAVGLVKELLEVPEGYSVMYLQGGASLQFVRRRAGQIVFANRSVANAASTAADETREQACR